MKTKVYAILHMEGQTIVAPADVELTEEDYCRLPDWLCLTPPDSGILQVHTERNRLEYERLHGKALLS